jgi:DNA-binding NtrC family response regulator
VVDILDMSMDATVTAVLPWESGRGEVRALRLVPQGSEYVLGGEERRWVVGTRDSCDLVLADPCVSGMHCVLERRSAGGPLAVKDRGSRNGTFVNGVAIESAELAAGSVLVVGKTTLIAQSGERSRAGPGSARQRLLGRDPQFLAAVSQAIRAAATDCSILLVGETGTGKDVFARLIHESSRRAASPLVAVNCGAIAPELIGSELFGHEKGAFTGAVAERDGYFVEASGGTLFLDELGELPRPMQPHLLRVLETSRVRRVGGGHERAVDVRIVAATNRLGGLGTSSSTLRLDLYHRVATVLIALPPLRARAGDIEPLVTAMLEESQLQLGKRSITAAAWAALRAHAWPGNVRELAHAVARATALGGEVLDVEDFFPSTSVIGLGPLAEAGGIEPAGSGGSARSVGSVGETPLEGPRLPPYAAMLRSAMAAALSSHRTIRAAAAQLGMPKSTFADKAKQWGLLDTRRKAG